MPDAAASRQRHDLGGPQAGPPARRETRRAAGAETRRAAGAETRRAAGAETRRAAGAESTTRDLAAGARAVAPIAIAVLAFGASFGILARDAGMGIVPPIVMSFTTFAGSAQFAVASVLDSGGAVAAAVAAAVMLNLRYIAVGMSVAPSLRGGLLQRLAVAQLAVDESWAVSQRDGRVDRHRLIGAGAVLMAAWCAGTVAGAVGGGALGDPADYGLDAMFPALFLALLVGQLTSPRARVAALAGGLVALALTPIVPPGLPIVAAAAGAFIALGVRS